MESTTAARSTARPRGLDAATACEAFQATVAADPDREALRTRGGELSLSWGEYGERARAIAAGLPATLVSMLLVTLYIAVRYL